MRELSPHIVNFQQSISFLQRHICQHDVDLQLTNLMVFHLPNQDGLRTQVNYTQAFALTLLWNIGLLGMLVTALFIISFFLKKYQLRINKNEALRESMVTAEERESTSQLSERQSTNLVKTPVFTNPKTKTFRVVNFLTSFFFYCFWIVGALIYLTFFMFNYFGRGTHIDLLSVFVMTLAVVLPALIWKYKTKVTDLSQLRKQIVFTVIILILWLCLCIFLIVATKGACVCYYNSKYGIPIEKDVSISTDFTRLVTLDQVCGDQQICHLYATVAEDASTSVFFNAHAGMNLDKLIFTLKLNEETVSVKNSSSPFKLDNVDSLGQRYVHSIFFRNLIPNATYSIEISNPEGSALKQAFYKTVPNATASEIRMAIGGDLGMTKNGQIMTSYLFQYNPDIIILGGDTVYDDGMRSCYYSWDNFYSMFQPVYDNLNRLVPLVMSIGNHDVGFDALTDSAISVTHDDMPLFFVFNPQHSSLANVEQPPSELERDSVHYHLIGPTIHLNLDSGYIKSFKDQVHFIRSIIQSNPGYYRFANYHNPLYPSCTNSQAGSNDVLVIQEGMRHWTPLFDEFNFTAGMQHHTHYRKMTYKIYNDSRSNDKGTRYLGDGSWGVTEMTCSEENLTPKSDLLQNYTNTNPNHMWQVTIKKGSSADKPYTINYTAINLSGAVAIQKIEDLPPLS